MRKSRGRQPGPSEGIENALTEAPWPKWDAIKTPGKIISLDFTKGEISPELYPLAKEFSNTLYQLRLEFRPRTIIERHRVVMDYLKTLSRCPELTRPASISLISEIHLKNFQKILSRPSNTRPVMKRARSDTRAKPPTILRGLVRDAWRLGIATGANRPDLGKQGLRNVPVKAKLEKIIYSKRELTAIIRFLVRRRSVERGQSLGEERAYLVTCICILVVFLPLNRSSAFALNMDSLQPGESGQKYDVIVAVKERPKQSANRLPETKETENEQEAGNLIVKRGRRQVRLVFEENIKYNKDMGRPSTGPLFECKYSSVSAGYIDILDRINDSSYSMGLSILHDEFDFLGDDGNRLKISLRKLRDTLENNLPSDVRMRDKAAVLNHKNLETTARIYEAITDNDHLKFQKGLKAISVAAGGSTEVAILWARDNELSSDDMMRLISGMQKTKTASCSNRIYGQFAPKNGNPCSNTLACFGCNALAVVVTDLYRLASLERCIKLDLESGLIQNESRGRFEEILRIIDIEIFSNFEGRIVDIARSKAERILHPVWAKKNWNDSI